MKIILICLLNFLVFNSTFAQIDNMANIFKPTPPKKKVNILYYHFYDGIQMIELDFRSPYNQTIAYYEQIHPRAIPYNAIIPPPHPNIYLFRNILGRIIKSYNLYGKNPADFKLTAPQKLVKSNMVFHSGTNYLQSAEARRYNYTIGNSRMTKPSDVYIFAEGGAMVPETMYERATGYSLKNAKFGLIDTTGEIIMSARYDYIEDFNSRITNVAVADKFGLINNKGIELLAVSTINCIYKKM